MELLLNLAWMLLALPGYWLWRQGAGARVARPASSLQFLLALGCALILLFPVISATDDLHAMRTEMEESSTSKRTVWQAGSERDSAWVHRLQGAPALAGSAAGQPEPQAVLLEVSDIGLTPLARRSVRRAGRAPPRSLLG
jgi:hypothetical protein